ncbi:AAA family ATPase [Acidimicrobiales bacterium]|nr:AAA family ATPase [Acidimicrobiales bacterium]
MDDASDDDQGGGAVKEVTNGLRLNQIDWDTFWDTDFSAAQWLCEPLLAKGRTHAIVAPAKAGKSLLGLEMAAALATGRPFLGKSEGSPVIVVYVDYEMTEADVQERLREFGYGRDDDLSRLIYILLPNILPLDTPGGGAAFVADVLELDAEVVIIDTMTRAVSGEENKSETARDFYRQTLQPLKSRGVTTIRFDHMGRDPGKGARGSSGKVADVDVEWLMTVKGDAISLKGENVRMNWVPKQVSLIRGTGTPMHTSAAVRRTESWDIETWLKEPKQQDRWFTAEEAASAMTSREEVESHELRRVRDQLNRLAKTGMVEQNKGQRGGSGGSSSNQYRFMGVIEQRQ